MKPGIAIALALCASHASHAVEVTECSAKEAQAAETGLGDLHSWADLQRAFGTFGKCDDGAIAEGYSDFVMRMMAQHWTDITGLAKLGSADPAFLRFVLRHIDETWTDVDFRTVMAHARNACPDGAKSLCAGILERGADFPEAKVTPH